MLKCNVGLFLVNLVGFGCMNMMYVYNELILEVELDELFNCVFDFGYNFFDMVIIYGLGESEWWIGKFLKYCCDEFVLVSKCVFGFEDGKWMLDV